MTRRAEARLGRLRIQQGGGPWTTRFDAGPGQASDSARRHSAEQQLQHLEDS